MRFLLFFDLFLCVSNAYFGATALVRGDWLWAGVSTGLSLLMLHNFNRRLAMLNHSKEE